MRTLSFQKCLDRALQVLHGRKGILYVSMGSFLKNNASLEKIHAQQAPLSLLGSGKPAVIILVDPLFAQNDPVLLHHLKEYQVRENGTEVVPSPHVVLLTCGEFLVDGSSALQKLARLVQQNPHLEFYMGDFTITQPCLPFDEYPLFKKKIDCMPNVWMSRSCTKENFANASYTCPILPSPFLIPQKQTKTLPKQTKTPQKQRLQTR